MGHAPWSMPHFVFPVCRLTLGDCSYRASTCASAAADASILVDNECSAIVRDSAYRAGSCTRTTADACITDNICHSVFPPLLSEITIVKTFYTIMSSFTRKTVLFHKKDGTAD